MNICFWMRLVTGIVGGFKEDVVMVRCLKTTVCSLEMSSVPRLLLRWWNSHIYCRVYLFLSSFVFIFLMDTPNLAVDCECRSQSQRGKKQDIHYVSWSSPEWSGISGRWDAVLRCQVIANTIWPLAFWRAGMCREQYDLHSYFSDTLNSQRGADC